jgi:hypothetical protein
VKEKPSSRSRRTDPVPKRAKKNMFKTLGVTEIKNAREMALLPYSPGS